MGITVTSNKGGGNFEPCPEYTGRAVCVDITPLKAYETQYGTKQKFKIAISGCTLGCSGVLTTDIGIMATRKGFDFYVGGKGGPSPKVGRRILRDLDEQEVVAVVAELVEFHDAHTETKQRMAKLLDHPDFPYKEAV